MTGLDPRLALLMLSLGLASHWGAYQHGIAVERTKAGQASAQRDSGDRLAEIIGERGARQEEQRRAATQEEARAHAQKERAVIDSDAAGANVAGQRLRGEATQFAAAISCPGPDTAAIARGQAATRAAMVLSDLLTRADERAGELAKAYDQAQIAGKACEASYNALIK
ncbi:DUF2514 domain-containing protein [Pseudomonas alloputida]|uniref:DUF2514 domain-containing protein n=1 Tax=Pseudomonas alloputida TaxID=1940621 RepID=UPI001E2EEB64|nr:DUF2514 domain-containing protein [Pseudomonas alloputida]MCE1055912.1 DUF2514 domain-containing protein [Pseudomonas alloputida]